MSTFREGFKVGLKKRYYDNYISIVGLLLGAGFAIVILES